MLTKFERELAWKYMPVIMQDKNETIPIRYIGVGVFDHKEPTRTFGSIVYDPAAWNAKYIIEYAVYWDYDIQHMYDLEHIVVAVGETGEVTSCCSSFHGMIVHSSAMEGMYREENGHPVLYMQPGKHAFMAAPVLFNLHVQKDACCRELAGGHLLVPKMLAHRMSTSPERDARIREWIRANLTFTPSWEFEPAPALTEEQIVSDVELLDLIPMLVAEQLKIVEGEYPDFYTPVK